MKEGNKSTTLTTTRTVTTLLLLLFSSSSALHMNVQTERRSSSPSHLNNSNKISSRRSFFSKTLAITTATPFLLIPELANAGIDPSALRSLPVEGDEDGTATRLRQIALEKDRPEDTVDKPWEDLPSGAQYREYREGRGENVIQTGSRVGVEMTIRCKSFATNNEPGGVKYFTTKDDTEFNEIAFTVGKGDLPPGLEEAMMGMKKYGIRRIELPSTQVFAAKKASQLPLPTTKAGQRVFDRLFKTDATLIFEVLVTRVKN